MKYLLIAVGFIFSILSSAQTVSAVPNFGRYIGVLHHKALNREQLAKLDFLVMRSNKNELELRAVLTLHFGDYKSGEYVSYHYEQVRYNVLTGTLVFSDAEQPLSIFVKNFSGEKFVGNVVSSWGGSIGELVLSREKVVTPTVPLMEPLWGEYRGTCGPEKVGLQLYNFRSTDDLAHQAQPFASYFIKGNLSLLEKEGQGVLIRITSGAYNFFRQTEQLTLVGDNRTFTCTVDRDNIDCTAVESPPPGAISLAKCSFQRVSSEAKLPKQLSPVKNEGGFSEVTKPAELGNLQSGEYRGYVFHEYLNRYQAVTLNLDVFQEGGTGGTRIASSAKLHFGDHSSPEVIPYSFSERVYPSPLAGAQNLVLSRIEANMDAAVQITSVTKDGAIQGTWNSLIFGRVGTFMVKKTELPEVPKSAEFVERLTGSYWGPVQKTKDMEMRWVANLAVVPGTKPPTQTDNPFFPNLLRGAIQLNPITEYIPITDGSYDFYTGKFGFTQLDGEGNEHAWIGTQVSRNELRLNHLPMPGYAVLPKHQPQTYTRRAGD